jgi:hypothetical protein
MSIKAHAQTISVLGMVSAFGFALAKGIQYAIDSGYGEYIGATILIIAVIFPLYSITYSNFKDPLNKRK